MLGRLIIALLVVGSAFFVALQRQKSESSDIGAVVASTQAAVADKRAADAETRVKEAEERASAAEAKAAYFQAQIATLTAAADDPIAADAALHVRSVRFTGVGKNEHGEVAQFALVLVGDATTVTRVSIRPQTSTGAPWGEGWDSQDVSLSPLYVSHAGRRLVNGHGSPVIATKDGATIFNVEVPVVGGLAPGLGYVFEVTRGDGKLVTGAVIPDAH